MTLLRRVIPFLLLPLSLVACGLASSPWLRAFPSAVLAIPLFGAALLSVLLPVVVIGIGVRKLWLTALIDVVGFAFFTMLVGLQELVGFSDLWSGLVHGPSQILSFALPLVSPRTLLVAPLALCWLSGAIVGECIGRGWQSVVPYVALLATFGLAYAGSARAVTTSADGRRYDTLLAGALLLTLLLLRAAQAWVEQDDDAESTQPEGILPLRGLAVGTVLSVGIACAAAAVVQTSGFSGRPISPSRVPPLNQSQPLTPIAFIADLRPARNAAETKLFRVTVDRTASSYLPIADLDLYDGDGWSFDRTFDPSGGIIPADTDPSLRPQGAPVTQQYVVRGGPMTGTPWMPFLYRPQRVSGTSVDIDATSGMIVPGSRLTPGQSYTVRSTSALTGFADLPSSSLVATSAPPTDVLLPTAVINPVRDLVHALGIEVRVEPTSRVAFLQAVAKELQTKFRLSSDPVTATATPTPIRTTPRSTAKRTAPGRSSAPRSTPRAASGTSKKRATPSAHRFVDGLRVARTTAVSRTTARAKPRPTPVRTSAKPSPTPSAPATSPSAIERAPGGATSFATVLGSIRGKQSASPEQYATFMALVARQIGVAARVVTGFRVGYAGGSPTMSAGTHEVTTRDAYTWVEIPIRGQGWVVLDPSPRPRDKEVLAPPDGASTSASPSPTPTATPTALVSQASDGRAVAPRSKIPSQPSPSAVSVLVVIAVVLAAIVLLTGLVLILRKRLRVRRRRRAGDPRRRLLGAWQESLDVLVESGLPDLTYLTSAEVARAIHEQFGGEPAAQAQYLGDSANAAIFSPTTWVGPQQADAAWRAQSVLRRTIRKRLSVRERMNASLRYHHTARPRPLVGPSSWATAARVRATTPPARGRHSTRSRARRRRRAH